MPMTIRLPVRMALGNAEPVEIGAIDLSTTFEDGRLTISPPDLAAMFRAAADQLDPNGADVETIDAPTYQDPDDVVTIPRRTGPRVDEDDIREFLNNHPAAFRQWVADEARRNPEWLRALIRDEQRPAHLADITQTIDRNGG
jgi:hypothetical protein